MADDLDAIPVLVGHLRRLERTLDTAYTLVGAEDLARQARSMGGRHQPSNLARALDEDLTRVRGWLRDAENAPQEEPDDD